MDDTHKTRAQLISELDELRARLARAGDAEEQPGRYPRFREWAETAASAVFIFQDSVLRYANAATSRLTGYTTAELVGANIYDLIHPDFRDPIRDRITAWYHGEAVPARSELKIVTRTGEVRWINADSTVIELEGKRAPLTVAFDSTEHKLAEAALNESEERYRNMIETAQEGIWVVDAAARTTYVNRQMAEMLGCTREEMLGRSAFHFVDKTAHDEARRLLERGKNGIKGHHDFRFRRKDRSDLWMIVSTTPLFDSAGQFAGGLAMILDITERKRAEQQILFQASLLDQVSSAVIALDVDQRVVFWNRFAESLYQWTREEVLGRNIFDLVVPEEGQLAGKEIIQALEQNGHWEGEFVLQRKDGSQFPAAIHNSTIRAVNGQLIGFVGVSTDITARKELDRALWESEDRFRSFMRHLPGYAWIKKVDGAYVYLNERLLETLSDHLDDWKGRTDLELFSAETAAEFQRNDRIVLKTRQSLQVVEAWTWQGEDRYVLVNKFPVFDAQGEMTMIAGASVDITDLKRAEQDVRNQKEILQKIFDHLPVMITFIGEDGGFKLINQECRRTLGWSLEEVLSQNVDIFAQLYPDPIYRQTVLKFVAESNGEWCEFKPRVRDGRMIDTSWAMVRLSDGTSIAIGQDITERKLAEQALRESEERYRELFENAQDANYVHDLDGRYTSVNRAAEKLSGYSRDELLGRAFADFIAPEHLENVRKNMARKLKEEGKSSYEAEVIAKDGRRVPVEVTSNLIHKNGAAVGVHGTARDISERKRAEELLRKQTAQLAALHEIGLEISAQSKLSRVLDVVTQRAADLLDASHCSAYIRGRDKPVLRLVASLSNKRIGLQLKEGEGLAGRVLLTGKAEGVENYSEWPGRVLALDAERFGPVLAAPLKWQETVIGAISVSRKPGAENFSPGDSKFLERLAAGTAIAIHQATLFDEVQESRMRLQVLSHKLIDAQEGERKRLARELHDQIGQALTAVQISLQALQPLQDDVAGSQGIEDSLAVIDDALEIVHDISLDLRPSMLDDLGLVAALRWYVDRVTGRAGLVKCFNAEMPAARLAPELETACFRIAQEALTNVVRHSAATTVWVQVKHSESGLQLVVRDDGVGFDVRAAMSRTGANASLGLQGMQERASALGGIVDIKSKPRNGAEVQISFPRPRMHFTS